MNFPLHGHIICNDTLQGPGSVTFDFKEYQFEPTFFTYENSEQSFGRVLEAIKRIGLMERGMYKWYNGHYGPVVINQIKTNDFVQIESYTLLHELDNIIDNIHELYFIEDNKPVDRQFIKDKIRFSLRLVPLDTVIFFKYNVPIDKTNIGSEKVVEHNLFCYFHSLIGYNQDKFYLLTMFYE